MLISMSVAVRLCVTLILVLAVMAFTSRSEAFSGDGVAYAYSASGDAPRARIGHPMTVAAESLPVSCHEAQAYAAQFGPQEAVREARRRKLSWAQIKRVKAQCFDRTA
jgi:hypothetical protein